MLRGVDRTSGPSSITQAGHVTEHVVTTARDRVVVTRLGEDPAWGLISYARPNGTWVHTANTPEGFARKLADLGITRASRSIGSAADGD